MAWEDLPPAHRSLLRAVGAHQREVVDRPLGGCVDDYRRSAGVGSLTPGERAELDRALGVWVQELGLVLIDAGHPAHDGLDHRTQEAALARIAWHEWGHALSIGRSTEDDLAAGPRLLTLAPSGVAESIRRANYGVRDYTHEIIAETYALLMARRRRGETRKPPWLIDEIYELVTKVTGWSE